MVALFIVLGRRSMRQATGTSNSLITLDIKLLIDKHQLSVSKFDSWFMHPATLEGLSRNTLIDDVAKH
jgi:hypothetical protein